MHNGFVQINAEKMSKSLGNFLILDDIFKMFDPMVVRFYFLNHHYRSPIEFTLDGLHAVQKSYQRLCKVFSRCTNQQSCDLDAAHKSPIIDTLLLFLQDDLNTVGMLGLLFENLDTIAANQIEVCQIKSFLQQVLGLTLEPIAQKAITITPEIQTLIDQRQQARAQKIGPRGHNS